jgi:hypothetical protein
MAGGGGKGGGGGGKKGPSTSELRSMTAELADMNFYALGSTDALYGDTQLEAVQAAKQEEKEAAAQKAQTASEKILQQQQILAGLKEQYAKTAFGKSYSALTLAQQNYINARIAAI